MLELDLQPLDNWLSNKEWPFLISGPCSAETEEQVVNTAKELAKIGKVSAFRAGIWKPRTRPGMFEGIGEVGLQWMQTARKETGLHIATEVATGEHVELALKYDVDVLWVGARTSTNPFSVQEVADALKGVKDKIVMVKNPINPDLALWMGALERINKAGITKLAAIHRGFSSGEKSVFRNAPMWNIPIELKSKCHNLPIVCDPSHICGTRELISFISQKALDLDMDGLLIESHISPQNAWSDASQQVTPQALAEIIQGLQLRTPSANNDSAFEAKLAELRKEIDAFDEKILHDISSRMKVVEKIGAHKKNSNVTILQMSRWEQMLEGRISLGKAMGLSDDFTKKMLELIHQESIRVQSEVINK